MRELHIEFKGNGTPRNQFVREILVELLAYFGDSNNALIQLVLEIIKNNWDHAEGKGSLAVTERSPGTFEFRVTDGGTAPVDLEIACRGSTKAGNGTNYGIGMGMIKDLGAMTCFTDFKIDTTAGFTYSGIFTK